MIVILANARIQNSNIMTGFRIKSGMTNLMQILFSDRLFRQNDNFANFQIDLKAG